MHSIMESAKWFVNKNGKSINRNKLQSLCYYAQAWSFSTLGMQPLFEDKFEASAKGPINHDLCLICGDYEMVPSSVFQNVKDTYFSEDELGLLDLVWDIYGDIESDRLACLIRCDDPWKETREGLMPGQSCAKEISFDKMKKYYSACCVF